MQRAEERGETEARQVARQAEEGGFRTLVAGTHEARRE
jgi:hypothetical protein